MLFELNLGGQRLVVNSELFTIKANRQLNIDLETARQEVVASIDKKTDDINKLIQDNAENFKRKKDEEGKEVESDEEFTPRAEALQKELSRQVEEIAGPDGLDSLVPYAFECIKLLARLAGREGIASKDNFENTCWEACKDFLHKVLLRVNKEKADFFQTVDPAGEVKKVD